MSFGSPESSKDFPGLYGHERHSDSDSEAQASKQLIGKRKDKKEKDIGYAALGDSSGDEEEDGKSPLRGKLGNPFKFSKKEKREKDKQRDHKEKELKAKESKERDLKLRKDAREMYKEEKIREKVREEKSKDKVKEEKLKEKEKHKEEKNKEKEKIKEEKVKEKAKEKSKEEKSKDKVKDPKEKAKEVKELKRKESLKDSTEERKKKKKDQNKVKERKKSDPAVALEEEPVFGVPLALAVERSKCHDGVQLPAVVRECIDYIEQNGLNCEGIYRLSGVKSKVQQLKRGYNLRDTVCLYDHEPHTVASLLKLFLRELPEPVLTAELLPLFDAAAGEKAPERRVKQLSELLDRLPDPNRRLVQYMLKHMEHIIKREKINKMNVQNVSLVLSPTMQISHRVLNAFFLYGKILFSGVTIKRYVPPIADGELPDSADAIREEIEKQESLLTQLHRELKAGSISQRREEQLWEAQRILTQLKRRQRFVTKRGEAESVGRPAEPEPSGDAAPAAADDTAAHRLERTVQIINEDNVTVIQIGEKAAPQPAAAAAAAAGPEPATAGPEPTASSELESAAAPESEPELAAEPETVQKPETEQKPKPEQELKPGTEQKPEQELKPEQEPELKPEREQELKTELKPELKTELKPEQEQRQELKPEQEMKLKPEQEQEQEPEQEQEQEPEPEAAGGETDGPVTSLPPPGDESQASFSDLHRRIVADAARSAEPAAAAADAGAAVAAESEETTDLLRQLVLLKLEEDELVSTGRELRSRLAAERSEIGRLRDTIQEMETLYKYRTYSVDSSDDSSGEDSEDSDTEEDMIRQLCDIVRHNQQIEAKNAQLVMSIHEERRCCQKRRAQIRYLELQPSGAP